MKKSGYQDILKFLLDNQYTKTCSMQFLKNNSVLFLSKEKYIDTVLGSDRRIAVITDAKIYSKVKKTHVAKNISLIPVDFDNAFYIFAKFHNLINKNVSPKRNILGKNVSVHETAALGGDGQRIGAGIDGSIERLKHIGNIVLGDNVVVDAFSSIHRASFDSTIIGPNSTLCSHVNIGHNCVIGNNVFVGPGTKVAGSVVIGDRCNIWQGSLIANGVKICADVTIGMGSVVTRDIQKPGVYFGSPCKKRRQS